MVHVLCVYKENYLFVSWGMPTEIDETTVYKMDDPNDMTDNYTYKLETYERVIKVSSLDSSK